MKISKWVDMGQEVQIEIGVEDIRGALGEAFATVTRDRLGEPGPNYVEVMYAFNEIATFLNAVTEEQIKVLTEGHRRIIGDFLTEQAERFKKAEAESISAK